MAPPRRTSRSRRAHDLVKDLHTYLGLLNFSHLIVFAIAGLVATFSPPPELRKWAESSERTVPFEPAAGMSDKEVADAVHGRLDLPLTGPIPEWAIRRDGEGNLHLSFYTPNGPHHVTVLEEDRLLRIETNRNSVWRFINNLHATLMVHNHSADWRLKAWTLYIEFALWSLTAMAFSGLYLWLSSRAAYRPALYLLAAGLASFILLYVLTR